MKQMLCKFVVLFLAVMLMSSCSRLLPQVDPSGYNKKVISASVTADSAPAPVKPSSTSPPLQDLPETLSSAELFSSIPLETSRLSGVMAFGPANDSSQSKSAGSAALVYDRTLLTEDVTWRGTVLVKGYVVVAPQATLRIEAGTVVHFAGTGDGKDAARLVVQGRIEAIGTPERPIILTSDRANPASGDWGGLLIVSSKKRNTVEQCRIEYAASGIESLFSTVSLKAVSIVHTEVGVLMRDSYVQMSGGTITDSVTGIKIHDSELELNDATVAANKNGIVMNRSAVGLTSVVIKNNELYGVLSDDCRINMSAAEISGNGTGVFLKGGEGQIMTGTFSGNSKTALHLSGSRIKVQRCQFVDNSQDALRLEDGRALIWGNAFRGNKGFNLYNTGREGVVAIQNWWGTSDRSVIMQKIYDVVLDSHSGPVQLFPWLNQKPALLP